CSSLPQVRVDPVPGRRRCAPIPGTPSTPPGSRSPAAYRCASPVSPASSQARSGLPPAASSAATSKTRRRDVVKRPRCGHGVGGVDLDRLPGRLVEFLDAAHAAISASKVPGRDIPLFAFPLVGTRRGGWDRAQGQLTRTAVRAVSEWVARHEADAVLVSWTPQ